VAGQGGVQVDGELEAPARNRVTARLMTWSPSRPSVRVASAAVPLAASSLMIADAGAGFDDVEDQPALGGAEVKNDTEGRLPRDVADFILV